MDFLRGLIQRNRQLRSLLGGGYGAQIKEKIGLVPIPTDDTPEIIQVKKKIFWDTSSSDTISPSPRESSSSGSDYTPKRETRKSLQDVKEKEVAMDEEDEDLEEEETSEDDLPIGMYGLLDELKHSRQEATYNDEEDETEESD